MTLSEFKAWFEGFSEGIDKTPTEDQFAKIRAKVALIDGAPITYPVFVDRYRYWGWPATGPYYPTRVSSGTSVALLGSGTLTTNLNAVGRNDGVGVSNAETASLASSEGTAFAGYSDGVHRGPLIGESWDSHAAMRELGRAEALN